MTNDDQDKEYQHESLGGWVGGKINRPGQVTPPPILLPISFYFSDTENKFIGSVLLF